MQSDVRDHIPLEQGLRPSQRSYQTYSHRVRDHIPLEQGLRQSSYFTIAKIMISQRPYSIRTRIKTLFTAAASSQIFFVRDHIPLEQGLRHRTIIVSTQLTSTSETIFH